MIIDQCQTVILDKPSGIDKLLTCTPYRRIRYEAMAQPNIVQSSTILTQTIARREGVGGNRG
jgi:hypothetical protein